MKYGKGKTISTAADVLEELAAEHEIVRKVLEYRQLTKLKGTYVDALPALIDPADGRLHTTLQPDGRGHRAALVLRTRTCRTFRSAPSWAARSARRSCRARAGSCWWPTTRRSSCACWRTCRSDPVLVEAFRNGEDIHTRTAAEVFGVPPLMVTPEARRSAKAVNFGIVYGISPFGLAAQLGISRARGGALHQELLRALRGGEAVHRRDHRGGAAARA